MLNPILSHQTKNGGGEMGFKDWCTVLVLVSSAGFIGMTMTVISPVLPLIIEHFGAVHGALIGQWRGRVLGFQVGFGCAMSVAAILAAGALGKTQGWRAPFELYLVPFSMLLLGALVLPAGLAQPAN